MVIPQEYIIQKFYQYAGYPRLKKSTSVYEGGCCMCREGSSWGRKRRLYFIVKDNIICCHNCGWYSSPVDWVKEVTGMSFNDILKETEEYDYIPGLDNHDDKPVFHQPDLPHDSVDLFDTHQLRYYNDNQNIKKCLDVIASRRLDTAVNRPQSIYTSISDKVHKNRLIIPFYNMNNKVSHYQSRKVIDDVTPKYLSKTNSEKTLFNVNKLSDPDHIFIFEGPIDSFFVKDSVAVAGIQDTGSLALTESQQKQLDGFVLSKKIWVLDNDQTGRSKSKKLLERDECVFIWPKELKNYKDFNDICVQTGRDEISREFVLKHSYCGLKGLVRLG